MKQKNNITHIYGIWTLKIAISIYVWLNHFFKSTFPWEFTMVVVLFFALEFIERFCVNLHKEIHQNNFWDYTVDNYDNFILSMVANWLSFWLTFALIIYEIIAHYGWAVGIGDAVLIYLVVLIWLSNKSAKFIFFLKKQFSETKVFIENITSPWED